MNIRLHPTLAEAISRAITQRSLASEMINTTLYRKDFDNGDFKFWRDEHIKASLALGELGIEVITYDADVLAEKLR